MLDRMSRGLEVCLDFCGHCLVVALGVPDAGTSTSIVRNPIPCGVKGWGLGTTPRPFPSPESGPGAGPGPALPTRVEPPPLIRVSGPSIHGRRIGLGAGGSRAGMSSTH